MTTLSLTLPISCQICLGKVKDPVICPNSHAFCTVCLDLWLQTNSCCPTCRVDITKDKPYRKVIGSSENNETSNLQTRMQLRKTRLELLGREYATEIQDLNHQLDVMTQENEKLKKELKTKEQAAPGGKPLLSNNVEALSSLTKKLQEISTTYDDVRRDMTKLQQFFTVKMQHHENQLTYGLFTWFRFAEIISGGITVLSGKRQEKEQLQRENNDLKNEVSKLKEDSKFTKSPKRYEKFTITGLKAKVEQYEKENQQLKKALENSDKYVEQLQSELRTLKTENAKTLNEAVTMINTQCENNAHEESAEIDRQELVPLSMVARTLSSHDAFETTVVSITPLNTGHSSELQTNTTIAPISVQASSHLRETIAEQCRSPQDDAMTPATSIEPSSECSHDLFPATKKLLALKKIHETRSSPSLPSPQIQDVRHISPVPAVELPWSTCVSYVSYDSSSDKGEEASCPSSISPSQKSSETFSCSLPESESQCSENTTSNVILTAAGPWAVPAISCGSEQTNLVKSPKRNTSVEPFLLNKKIKVEKD